MFDASTLVVFQFHQSQFESGMKCFVPLLSGNEQREVNKFKITKQKYNFIISRCFSRILLGSFNHIDLSEISFTRSEFGKPTALDKNVHPLYVQFSVSHSNDFCFLAFGSKAQFGVDVEFIDSNINVNEIASVYFSKEEQGGLQGLQGEALLNEFYYIWTLKEAYLKSIGVGLNADLSQISTLKLVASNTGLLSKLDMGDENYEAAIACNNSAYTVKLLTPNESYAFIKPLIESALKR